MQPLEPLDPSVFHALVLLNLLFVSGAWALGRPSRWAAAVLASLSVAWLFGNGPIEGQVLVSIDINHGFTESDLLSVIGIVIGAITFARTLVRRRHKK